MLAGVPVRERRLTAAGVSTCRLEGGEGPPLVLLHGGIESGGAVWTPVISRLAQSHRVLVPDQPGFGESGPVERLGAAAFADWFTDVLRQTCTEKPTLVAHSLAGSLAARFAAEYGHLLSRLVVYAAPAIGVYRMPVRLRVVAIRFAFRPSEQNAERFYRFALRDLAATRERDPEWFDAFAAYNLSRAVVPHVKRTMQRLIKVGTKQLPELALRRIAIPTALIWGRQDRMVPLAVAEAAGSRLGWPLHVIDDVAHVPQIERPDAFVEALADATRTVVYKNPR